TSLFKVCFLPPRSSISFLFLGPTGVGKTELRKTLAGFLFDTQESHIQIKDKSSRSEEADQFSLAGSVLEGTQGGSEYVATDIGQRDVDGPAGLEGRFPQHDDSDDVKPGGTDPQPSRGDRRKDGRGDGGKQGGCAESGRHHQSVHQIVDIQLHELQTILSNQRIILQFSDKAKVWLADQSYGSVYGVWALNRTLAKQLRQPLAAALLDGTTR
ncbi:ATP-dependent Clp protease ATP-binding subunit ClpB, partial [Puccinia sorghi]